MQHTLSVLITYHSERELLTECIASLLGGAERPDEIIVYDDASPAPAEDFIDPTAGIRVIRGQQNRGPAFGRNILMRVASCDYVHFHDADDLFHPEWLTEVRAVLERESPDIVLTEVMATRDGALVTKAVMHLASLPEAGDLVRFGLRGALLLPSTTYRRELGMSIGGFAGQELLAQSEDFHFHIRLAASARSWRVIPRSLVIQRLRAGSHSSDQVSVWVSGLRAVELLTGELSQTYRADLADAAARIGSRLFALGARRDARLAFQLARWIAQPTFRHRSRSYRIVAQLLGQETAERVSDAVQVLRAALRDLFSRRSATVGGQPDPEGQRHGQH